MSIISFIKKICAPLIEERYTIGFVQNNINDILSGKPLDIIYLTNPYHDRWFADPFILDSNDTEIKILVEEYVYATKLGRIAMLVINKQTYQITEHKVILDLDTHLSYPCILRKDNKVYVYPENSAALTLKLYELDIDTMQLIEVTEWSHGYSLADATLYPNGKEDTLFATEGLAMHHKNILSIFKRSTPMDMFTLDNVYHFNENIARMGGNFFVHNNKIYRPAQECNQVYGHAIVLQEVTQVENEWQFVEVRRLYSTSRLYSHCLHTFNMYKDCIVIDGRGYRYPVIGDILTGIRNLGR